jgi:hypothetical protein
MKHVTGLVFTFAAALALTAPAFAADPPAKTNAQGMPLPGNPGAFASNEAPPTVPPAAPGVFQVQKRGANRFHLVLTGHKFVSRHAAELYLAYRASEITAEQKGSWFTFTESRTKGDTPPCPSAIPPPTVSASAWNSSAPFGATRPAPRRNGSAGVPFPASPSRRMS